MSRMPSHQKIEIEQFYNEFQTTAKSSGLEKGVIRVHFLIF